MVGVPFENYVILESQGSVKGKQLPNENRPIQPEGAFSLLAVCWTDSSNKKYIDMEGAREAAKLEIDEEVRLFPQIEEILRISTIFSNKIFLS